MKNKSFLIAGTLLIGISILLMILAEGSGSELALFMTGLVGFGAGLFLLVYWNTLSYKWVCKDCGEEFTVTLWQNFTGINAINEKRLFKNPKLIWDYYKGLASKSADELYYEEPR